MTLNVSDQKFTSYLEDLVFMRLKRVQLQLQVPQVPESHGLKTKEGLLSLIRLILQRE